MVLNEGLQQNKLPRINMFGRSPVSVTYNFNLVVVSCDINFSYIFNIYKYILQFTLSFNIYVSFLILLNYTFKCFVHTYPSFLIFYCLVSVASCLSCLLGIYRQRTFWKRNYCWQEMKNHSWCIIDYKTPIEQEISMGSDL